MRTSSMLQGAIVWVLVTTVVGCRDARAPQPSAVPAGPEAEFRSYVTSRWGGSGCNWREITLASQAEQGVFKGTATGSMGGNDVSLAFESKDGKWTCLDVESKASIKGFDWPVSNSCKVVALTCKLGDEWPSIRARPADNDAATKVAKLEGLAGQDAPKWTAAYSRLQRLAAMGTVADLEKSDNWDLCPAAKSRSGGDEFYRRETAGILESCLKKIRDEAKASTTPPIMTVDVDVKAGEYDFGRKLYPLAAQGSFFDHGAFCAQAADMTGALPALVIGHERWLGGNVHECTRDLVLVDVPQSVFSQTDWHATVPLKIPEGEARDLRPQLVSTANRVILQIAFERGAFGQTHLVHGRGVGAIMGANLKPVHAFKGRAIGYRVLLRPKEQKKPATPKVLAPWRPMSQEG